MSAALSDSHSKDMFRPPINHAMKILDRSFFQRDILLTAARILEKRHIAKFQSNLHHDILKLDRVTVIKDDPVKEGFKSLLLRPGIKFDGTLFSQ